MVGTVAAGSSKFADVERNDDEDSPYRKEPETNRIEKGESDIEYTYKGLPFIMNNAHLLYLMGMEIDWQDGLNARGFSFTNPNASKTCGCGTSFAV